MANIKTSELTIKDSPSTSATLVGVDNGETVQIPIGVLGGGIIDVDSLPTENINMNAIYKTNKIDKVNMVVVEKDGDGAIVNKHIDFFEGMSCDIEVVDTLPTVGKVGVDFNTAKVYFYYNLSDNLLYIYVTEEIASQLERPLGWSAFFPAELLRTIYSLDDATSELLIYLLATKSASLYYYDNEWVKISTDKNGKMATEEYVDEKVNSISGGSSGGGGASIIDITDFPSNPSTSSIYRKWQVIKAELYFYQTKNSSSTVHIVNTLPEVGEMAYDGTNIIVYYNRADDSVKGYVDSIMSSEMEVPVGWYPVATLVGALGYDYGGAITSLDEATSRSFYTLVTKKPHLYCYHNNGSTVEKAAIITNNNYEFDEATGTLTQTIVL